MEPIQNVDQKIEKTNDEWKKELTPEEYRILREKGTEAPFSGEYDETFNEGTYVCAACGLELFNSDYKFDSGCGWPAFDRAIPGTVELSEDFSHGMHRVEATCTRCGGHLGHIFPDGPKGELKPGIISTGDRFCINSVSMKFIPKKA